MGDQSIWEWPGACTELGDEEFEELLENSMLSSTGINRDASNSISTSQSCNHSWVNISFAGLQLACKYCGVDKKE